MKIFNDITLINGDCMEGMKDFPDDHFDLAIVDPPYGIGDITTSAGNRKRKTKHKRVTWNNQIPSKKYFDEMYRISKNQIIWGGQLFLSLCFGPGTHSAL